MFHQRRRTIQTNEERDEMLANKNRSKRGGNGHSNSLAMPIAPDHLDDELNVEDLIAEQLQSSGKLKLLRENELKDALEVLVIYIIITHKRERV